MFSSLPPSPLLFLVSWYGDSRVESSASLGLDGARGGGRRDGRRGRGGGAGRGGRRGRVGVAVALGVGAVEAALEGPGVRRRRADALGRAAAAAVASRGRGREAPPHHARRRRRGPRGGRRAAVVAVEPAILAGGVDVVGRHAQFLRLSDLQMPKRKMSQHKALSGKSCRPRHHVYRCQYKGLQ